jgi:hypothetical protein
MCSIHSERHPKVSLRAIYRGSFNCLEKKTLVLDIDETLVFATTNRAELKQVDETIYIKMTKFGASVRAYLSYRPYLFQFLETLRNHFELILYTCGTASYAAAFAESVEKNGAIFAGVLQSDNKSKSPANPKGPTASAGAVQGNFPEGPNLAAAGPNNKPRYFDHILSL